MKSQTNSVSTVTRLWTGWPGFNSWQGQGIFSLPLSRLALWSSGYQELFLQE